MTPDEAREHLRNHHRAVLSTIRHDGRPQLSLVAATVDADGRVIVSTTGPTAKVHNLRRDPRIALCVFTDRFYGPWVQVEGMAEIVERPEAVELLVDYYRRISGEHPDWDDYRRAMNEDKRVLVRFEIERVAGG